MYRYFVKMKKGKKEIYGEAYEKQLIIDFIMDNEKVGFKVIEKNF